MENIYIYHTNDVHSHLENWPRISQFLTLKKEMHDEMDEDVFIFDIGDFIDRWHPYTEATKGKGNIDLLNESQYTAVTIGNNEGVNLPYDDLNQLYETAQFDVLLANLFQQDGTYPNWVKPYKIYHTRKGTKIGVIGLTAYFTHLYGLLGWKLTEPFTELKKWIEQLKAESDVIILLSHLGLHDDEELAAEFPDIDVILGSHTHHFLEKGKYVEKTLLGAAGKYGYYVGQVTLQLNNHKTIIKKEAILYDSSELPMVYDEPERIAEYYKKGKNQLNQKVTTLAKPLQNDFFHETEFSHLLCTAIREWCNSDCAMINAGLLLGPLAGEVTVYDLLTICPHPINPCVIELTGYELEKVLWQTKDKSLKHREIKGLGFRGTVLGVFVYDRISFDNEVIYINGQELDPAGNYTLALPDMFTFGHFFKDVLPQKEKKYYLPEFLRDILKWKLLKHY
jgi:5'-nucleotidase